MVRKVSVQVLDFMLVKKLVFYGEFDLQTTLGASDESCLSHELEAEGFYLLNIVQLVAKLG